MSGRSGRGPVGKTCVRPRQAGRGPVRIRGMDGGSFRNGGQGRDGAWRRNARHPGQTVSQGHAVGRSAGKGQCPGGRAG